ncbi:MAG: pseudouridine-5'-phosphate glycosidase [Roseiflexus sp.]|nr:pseudouridine-5'-phosphate glycosidase [Roseiflexus sp.]MCS7289494.1 pseudouridine-5'-phosphate glycosidase [Roseiflexus sp.]MDW8147398.1 pseudouridine-5'-phosphate glycosidase [Roseiflexaceae bacterium]MDW8234441.1 pseudouridine-5'-phosphate glycosidase [Roseiflexaceae bacterium]
MDLSLAIAPEVQEALDTGRPVVALESTVISHGLPYPHNLELARAMEQDVRDGGAVPATVGIVAGVPTVGMDAAAIERFARTDPLHRPSKVSRRDLGYVIAAGGDGATTVAATMALAHLAGVQVFATGGIGGVHRGARENWDVSADLTELARTPVLVVCAGAKAILDLPATLEYLETSGVPVLGWRTNEFPAFYSASSGLPVAPAPDAAFVARAWRAHRALGGAGMLLTVPPPAEHALDRAMTEAAIECALRRAQDEGIHGPAVTPFLLAALARETGGESVRANIALLRQNARVAAQVAAAIANLL